MNWLLDHKKYCQVHSLRYGHLSAMKASTLRKDKINVVTLGCSKNLVDSETIITQLEGNNFEVTHEEEDSDANVIIVNTCGFIDLAKQESIETILDYAEEKKKGNIEKLYVTGCLSHRYKENLEEEIPEVDAYFGTMELPSLLARLEADYKHELIGERTLATPPHYAYLKISEGCNRKCSFCAIPLMRGKHISKPQEALLLEVKNLARRGVKEIMLIGQELTYYGLDLYKRRALPELLEKLAVNYPSILFRLHYAYPHKFPTDILPLIRKYDNIANYLDIPLQHSSDNMLKAMKRQITAAETQELINTIRKEVPAINIRTSFIVGFPGETLHDFESLCTFVKENRFDRIGVFMYSHEEDTSAYQLEDTIDQEEKANRANILMDIQRRISLEKNQDLIGTVQKVMVDRVESGQYICRTEADSPDVDYTTHIPLKDNYLRIGDFANCCIVDADSYVLYGKTIQNLNSNISNSEISHPNMKHIQKANV